MFIVLCCIVLCCVELYCVVLCCSVVLCRIELCSLVQCRIYILLTKHEGRTGRGRRGLCKKDQRPIFSQDGPEQAWLIRVLGAILILLGLFSRNFIFGAEANISARDEVRHVIATKFQPG